MKKEKNDVANVMNVSEMISKLFLMMCLNFPFVAFASEFVVVASNDSNVVISSEKQNSSNGVMRKADYLEKCASHFDAIDLNHNGVLDDSEMLIAHEHALRLRHALRMERTIQEVN